MPRRTAGMKYHDFDFHTRPPYDDETSARALRSGVSTSGYTFRYLMPRYELDDGAACRPSIAYLGDAGRLHRRPGWNRPMCTSQASSRRAPTALARRIFPRHPARLRRGAQPGPAAGPRASTCPRRGAGQRWQLHIWELEGDAEHLEGASSKPAMRRGRCLPCCRVSARDQWQPVHEFCAGQRIPRPFPNTDVPGGGEDTYNFYLSRGVILDAQVLAPLPDGRSGPARHQAGGPGRRAGAGRSGVCSDPARRPGRDHRSTLEQRPFPGPAGDAGQRERRTGSTIWARPTRWSSGCGNPDLAAFAARLGAPPAGSSAFVSGRLVEPERVPLDASVARGRRDMIYPYDPPGALGAARRASTSNPGSTSTKLPATGQAPPGQHRHRLRHPVGEPGAYPGLADARLSGGNRRIPRGQQQRTGRRALSALHPGADAARRRPRAPTSCAWETPNPANWCATANGSCRTIHNLWNQRRVRPNQQTGPGGLRPPLSSSSRAGCR
ncbi:MAG: hypothetical protein MZW92_76335 [Comamonadaceae bacterium]|nr:hypothetical protein [Comamonadaceae bacterium]